MSGPVRSESECDEPASGPGASGVNIRGRRPVPLPAHPGPPRQAGSRGPHLPSARRVPFYTTSDPQPGTSALGDLVGNVHIHADAYITRVYSVAVRRRQPGGQQLGPLFSDPKVIICEGDLTSSSGSQTSKRARYAGGSNTDNSTEDKGGRGADAIVHLGRRRVLTQDVPLHARRQRRRDQGARPAGPAAARPAALSVDALRRPAPPHNHNANNTNNTNTDSNDTDHGRQGMQILFSLVLLMFILKSSIALSSFLHATFKSDRFHRQGYHKVCY